MTELSFGPDGFVDMDTLASVDPDEALAPEVYERLHAALVAAPLRAPTDAQWTALIDAALHEERVIETDWLVPLDTPADEIADDTWAVGEIADPDAGSGGQSLGPPDWFGHEHHHDDGYDDFRDADGNGSDEGDPWT